MKMSENSAMSHRELCDKTNSLFLERDEVFWNSLWSFQFSFGPKLLPFYTSFCIGSGKQKYRLGMPVNTEPWFDLRKQSFQSSTPPATGIFSFCFQDAFDGGTCLKLESDQSTRLFVCEFDCQQDIILSYAFKTGQYLEQQADLEVLLKVKDEDSKKNVTVVCGAKNDFQNIDLIFNQNLSANNMRILTTNIEVSKEIKLPGIAEINGWKIRYHYLKFGSSTKLITDIGVRKIGPQSSELLIGAISVVKGLSNKDEMLHIPYIEF